MTTRQSYQVVGMTCEHCVNAVSAEVGHLAGVSAVTVALVSGGASTVAVTSDNPLDVEQVRAAVDEAGYELAGAGS